MSTPVSSLTSYATPTDLINSREVKRIGHWATDTGVPLTPAAILTDPVVAAALLRASGEVEMACFRGKRYTPTDLSGLIGASAASLKGLVCDLAMYHLAKRRISEPEKISGYKEARELLDALNKGELIFGIQEAADAGNIDTKVDLSIDSSNNPNRPTELAFRLFGRRMDNWNTPNQDRLGG